MIFKSKRKAIIASFLAGALVLSGAVTSTSTSYADTTEPFIAINSLADNASAASAALTLEGSYTKSGNVSTAVMEYTPNTSGEYYFEDSESTSSTIKIVDKATDKEIQSAFAKNIYLNTSDDVKSAILVGSLVKLEKNKVYTVKVTDSKPKASIAKIICSSVEGISESTVSIPTDNSSSKQSKLLKVVFSGSGTKSMTLQYKNYGSVKPDGTVIQNDKNITVAFLNEKGEIASRYSRLPMNMDTRIFSFQLPAGTYYCKIDTLTDSVKGTAYITLDESKELNIGSKLNINLAKNDLFASTSFKATKAGTYILNSTGNIKDIMVNSKDAPMDGGSNFVAKSSPNGKAHSLVLEDLVAGGVYNVYSIMTPGNKGNISLTANYPSLVPYVSDVNNEMDKLFIKNGYYGSVSKVGCIVNKSALSSKKAYLNGKAIAWPSSNAFSKEGNYRLEAKSSTGKKTTYTFTIDRTPPAVSFKDINGKTLKNNASIKGYAKIFLSDIKVSSKKIEVLTKENDYKKIPWPKNSILKTKGTYVITLKDGVKNTSTTTVTIK